MPFKRVNYLKTYSVSVTIVGSDDIAVTIFHYLCGDLHPGENFLIHRSFTHYSCKTFYIPKES